jgi:iron complex outermembrane recepter protein
VDGQGNRFPAGAGRPVRSRCQGRTARQAAHSDVCGLKTNIVQALGGTPFSIPVGRAESKGVELDINGRINENWSVIASYSYDDARITNGQGPSNFDPTVTLSENGNRLQDVPLNAGALWLKYSASGPWNGLSLGGGVVAVGERVGDNQNDYALPAYARIDSMIQYRWIPPAETGRKARFQLNVRNLANAVYSQNSSSRFDAFPGAPRTFLASFRAEF